MKSVIWKSILISSPTEQEDKNIQSNWENLRSSREYQYASNVTKWQWKTQRNRSNRLIRSKRNVLDTEAINIIHTPKNKRDWLNKIMEKGVRSIQETK